MARLILSAGMFSALAAAIAVLRRGLVSASPPFFAAMLISLIRRVKVLPRFASSAPFLCLMVAHLEWPDIGNLAGGQTPDYNAGAFFLHPESAAADEGALWPTRRLLRAPDHIGDVV